MIGNSHGSADISGGGTLEFTKRVDQTIDFGTGGGTLESARSHGLCMPKLWPASPDSRRETRSALAGDWAFQQSHAPDPAGRLHLTLTSGSDDSLRSSSPATSTKSDFAIASGATTTIKFA